MPATNGEVISARLRLFRIHLALLLLAESAACGPATVSRGRSVGFLRANIPWRLSAVLPPEPQVVRSTVDLGARYSAKGSSRGLEDATDRKSLYTIPVYGGIHDYAYYFVTVMVGTPQQRQSVILDTGSSLFGFPCRSCVHCGTNHIDAQFDFNASSTAAWLPCRDQRCHNDFCSRASASSSCRYRQSYTEGSLIEGTYFSDIVALDVTGPAARYDYIGCHDKETELFTTQKANGIMGVAFPRHGAQRTVMDALLHAVGRPMFAVCLAEEGGQLVVGGYTTSFHSAVEHNMTGSAQLLQQLGAARPQALDGATGSWNVTLGSNAQHDSIPWTPILSATKYVIRVAMLSAAQDSTSTPETLVSEAGLGACVVDSGTTFTYLVLEAFHHVMLTLERSCAGVTAPFCFPRGRTAPRNSGPCWRIDNPTAYDRLPVFLFHLHGGAIVQWKAYSYLYRRENPTTWCVAIDVSTQSQSILGMSFMKRKNVIFDRGRKLIGMRPTKGKQPLHSRAS